MLEYSLMGKGLLKRPADGGQMTSARDWHVVDSGRTASRLRFEDESNVSTVARSRAIGRIETWTPARWDDARSCRLQRPRRPSAACVRPERESRSRGECRRFVRCPAEPHSNTCSSIKILTRTGLAPSLPMRAIQPRGSSLRPGVMPRRGCRDVGSSAARCARVMRNADSLAWMARAWAYRARSARLSHAITRSSQCTNADAMASGATA
jgi:hypothetical protein